MKTFNGKYYEDRPDTYVLVRPEGQPFFGPATHNECFAKLHKSQGQSTSWALEYGGWAWVHAEDLDDFLFGWADDGVDSGEMKGSVEAYELGRRKAAEHEAFQRRVAAEAEAEKKKRRGY